jgi:uncharacterized protein
MRSVLVAYSGGVDSSLLLKVARDILADKVLAVTAQSLTYPKDEIMEAKKLAKRLKVKHLIIKTNELKNLNFANNPFNRCYFCKKELFGKLIKIAKARRINFVVDGSNLDDDRDYRPGSKALKEFKVRSPLKEAGFSKKDIRNLSKELKLPTWNKPAFACLASRIPYRDKIDKKSLGKIQQAENLLKKLDFSQLRVRHHKNLARIEVPKTEIPKIIKYRDKLARRLKNIGYKYICLDLEGYRTGSLNEDID